MALKKVLVRSLLLGLAASVEETCHVDGTCLSGVEDVDATEVDSVSLLQTQMETTPISAEETIAVYTPSEKKVPEDAVSLVEEGPEMAAEDAISSAEKKEMLDLHNMYRCMAGVPALQWDDTLQQQAQSWADTGATDHSTSRGAFKKYGENMQFSCPISTPKDATDWWYAEIEKYSESSPYQSSHYTQMVWKGSTKIGCGKGKVTAPCSGDVWFCQFTSPGNWNNAYKENVIAPTKSKAEAKAGNCAAPAPADSSGGSGGGGGGACTPGFLCSQKGKSASAFDATGYCQSMSKSYDGHGWSASGGVAKISVTCSGAKFNVECEVSDSMTITSCTGPTSSLYSSNVPNVGFAQSSAMLGAAADMVEQCDAKIERFDSLNKQKSFSAGYDPEFPPEMQSIGAAGSTCGDTAAGLSEGCEKYDNWKTMQDVAKTHDNTFSVIGTSGINWNDIQQGVLGNCYFLAALASIAKQQPDVIDNMFVDRDLWSQNIFKTRWFINGKESIVTVDNMIPADDSGTFFTHQSPTGEFWTVILAKTWAKIYGNFKAVEAGIIDTVIRAITGSASESFTMSEQTADKLWDRLVTGTEKKFPMGAGTGGGGNPTTYGLAVGHAYGVLGVAVDGTYGKVVKMYNPWGSDNYVGGVPNTKKINGPNKGKFTMKFEEFMDAYSDASMNFVIPGYKVTTIAVPAGKLAALDVTVSSPGKFWVSMVWPTRRMVAPCPYFNPSGYLQGVLGGGGDDDASKQLPPMSSEALDAEFANPSGGTYNVLAIETFSSSAAWIKTIQILVYAPVKAAVATSTESTESVALKMFGPAGGCEGITVSGIGFMKLDVSKTVAGVPTYWTGDGTKFLYYAAWSQKWNSMDGPSFESIQAGGTSRYEEFDKSAMKCGCEDDSQGVVSWGVACNEVIAPNVRYSNVQCQGQSSSGAVQNACPKTCNVCPGEGDAGDAGGEGDAGDAGGEVDAGYAFDYY